MGRPTAHAPILTIRKSPILVMEDQDIEIHLKKKRTLSYGTQPRVLWPIVD